MNRTDLLNLLAERFNYQKYLEIGVRNPKDNFNRIRVPTKHGVDPAPRKRCTYETTSKKFFEKIQPRENHFYDLVLIDGLHLAEQALEDIQYSLNYLSSGGTIVVHDCNPPTEAHQTEHYDGKSAWNGTVWKAFAELRMKRSDLTQFTIDTDWGLGVVRPGRQDPFPVTPKSQLNFEFLQSHRRELLRLVSVEEFHQQFDDLFSGV